MHLLPGCRAGDSPSMHQCSLTSCLHPASVLIVSICPMLLESGVSLCVDELSFRTLGEKSEWVIVPISTESAEIEQLA